MNRQLPCVTTDLVPTSHGFFTREGGVSTTPYDTLNGGWNTDDTLTALHRNWQRLAAHIAVPVSHFMSVEQVHGIDVIEVKDDTSLWSIEQRPKADALITTRADVAISVATADCAPVLFSSEDGRVVGAAHAGWRGAVHGVLEATVERMRWVGAQRIVAVIGPCIAASSYEVGNDMRAEIIAHHPQAERFFTPLLAEGRVMFDLPRFCAWRLKSCAVTKYQILGIDTRDDMRFFSHRRACLAGSSKTGRQISAIRPFFQRI